LAGVRLVVVQRWSLRKVLLYIGFITVSLIYLQIIIVLLLTGPIKKDRSLGFWIRQKKSICLLTLIALTALALAGIIAFVVLSLLNKGKKSGRQR
jgi:hypothetical protein